MPRISLAGTAAVLLDAAGPRFDEAVQLRVWAVAEALLALPAVRDVAPGMNNLLVCFDPFASVPDAVMALCRDTWAATPARDVEGRSFSFPVLYGGAGGEDLPFLAAHTGLTVDEVVRRHAAATYRVAAVGAMPGNPYMFGLDPALACPRRAVPRLRIPPGSVIIAGQQAGIFPIDGPCGWHMLGRTEVVLFDPAADPPCLFRPGDRVRFTVQDIAPWQDIAP